jgi:hypothetical protein
MIQFQDLQENLDLGYDLVMKSIFQDLISRNPNSIKKTLFQEGSKQEIRETLINQENPFSRFKIYIMWDVNRLIDYARGSDTTVGELSDQITRKTNQNIRIRSGKTKISIPQKKIQAFR